jgi:hypothetical protein
MSMFTDEAAVRKRAWHYLSPEVAAVAGMSIFQLQQFVAGTFHPTDDQIHALAIRMQLYPEPAK